MPDFRRPRYPVQSGSRHEGAILIIAIGILTLLALLGATFANLMRLEKQATQNFIDSQEVDLINDSALEHVIAELRGADNWRSFTPYRAPWLYKLKAEDDLAHGLEALDSPKVRDWELLSEKQKNRYRYKVKVIDTSAQINLNGPQDTLGRMLDNLGRAIAVSTRLNVNVSPFWSGPKQSGNRLQGNQIIQFRNKLEGSRFRSKTQLRELIGSENFEIVKDFVCVESFVDPYTYRSADGINEIVRFGETRGGAAGRAVGGAQQVPHPRVESPSARLAPEPRSPININTAPEEVIIACLQGLGCRRAFPYSKLTYAPIDQGAMTEGQPLVGREEKDNVMPRGVWIYSDQTGEGFPYEKARVIAQRIIAYRKQTPFLTWSTGDKGQPGGFAEFINDLEDSFFPSHASALVLDPRLPLDRRVNSEIIGGGLPELSRMWLKGHDPRERAFRDEKGLPYHQRNAFYYEMIKSMILSNANPNTRINRYNPNGPGFVPVDKSDLVRLDRDRQTPRMGHTTEFCYDTGGIYEVTTLSEIAEQSSPGEFRSLYRKPMRTVVKVFDVLRHTSQNHFEKTFSTGDRSSRSNRRFVVTFPDPMTALTDAVGQGSRRDGSVQLAGHNDGRRLLAAPQQRFQAFQSPETILMAHGFQDREEASYQQLRRFGRSASVQFTSELLKVLNASFSRRGKRLREMYTREELSTMGFQNQTALNRAPLIDTEEVGGTDLFPDGFHQSILTTSHLGGRFVYLPSHQRMGDSLQGGMARQVGAGTMQNATGNVPYYNGGIAFWVKFDFDGDDPVFSGLIGCTSVVKDVGRNPEDSEGSQFYIFKNTEGNLRIVRMYYHQAFPEGSGGEGGEGGAGGIELWPPDPTQGDAGAGGGTPGENPIKEHLDQKKKVARADYILDVRKFRAHEWHHIAVDWNDDSASTAIQVHIDFEKVQEGGPYIRHEPSGEVPTAWVRLNCRRPRDELFIGGFIRSQGVSDSGVFKWFTNIADGVGGSGVVPVEQSMKRVIANATIDEVITYDGPFQQSRSYYGTGSNGYFSVQPGEYANVFEVPLPPEVDYVVLRSFDWTAYYPSFFTTRDGQVHRIVTPQPFLCQVFPGRDNIAPFDEPWRPARRNTTNPVSNRRLQRRDSKGLMGMNADLVYQFKIAGGKVQAGSLAGGVVQTPVLDDVTLTYFLPDPKILLQEEAEEVALR